MLLAVIVQDAVHRLFHKAMLLVARKPVPLRPALWKSLWPLRPISVRDELVESLHYCQLYPFGCNRLPGARLGSLFLGLQANVIPVSPASSGRVGRRHAASTVSTFQQPLEDGSVPIPFPAFGPSGTALQQLIRLRPDRAVQNGRMLAGVDLPFVVHLEACVPVSLSSLCSSCAPGQVRCRSVLALRIRGFVLV